LHYGLMITHTRGRHQLQANKGSQSSMLCVTVNSYRHCHWRTDGDVSFKEIQTDDPPHFFLRAVLIVTV
jgi:hypothetical protein